MKTITKITMGNPACAMIASMPISASFCVVSFVALVAPDQIDWTTAFMFPAFCLPIVLIAWGLERWDAYLKKGKS